MYHFSENIKNGTIFFDYQLKEGVLKKGNAINILELNGYPESVIKEAKEYISDQFNLLNS